jgi:hypothetical protein
MRDEVLDDRVLTQLSRLAALSPDSVRADRVRVRCRAQLARRARVGEPSPGFGRRVLAPAIVLSACGIYIYSLVSTALHLTGMLPPN